MVLDRFSRGILYGMDPKVIFVVLTLVVGTLSFLPYFRDILSKKNRPHIYTWLVFSLISWTTTAIAFSHGGGLGTIGFLFAAILNSAVLLFALRYGKSPITKSDTALLLLCLIAIVIWWQLKNPLLALLMVTVARGLSFIPTIRKSYFQPWGETLLSWTGFTFGNICTILSLREYNLLTLTYLITISILNLLVVGVCLTRRNTVRRPISVI